jgi:hypothetical protein
MVDEMLHLKYLLVTLTYKHLMTLLKEISVIALLLVVTAGISGAYVEKRLQVTQFIENTENQVSLQSKALSENVTKTVTREEIEIVVRDLTDKVVEAKQEAVQATVQSAQIQGATQALAPMLANPALSDTLKTLAESPQAVQALTQVADAVEQASEATDNSAIELITRIDSVENNIKKLEEFNIPSLITKLEDLSKNTPSLTALDEAIKKTTDELTKRGDEAIAKEVDKLASKLSDQILSTNQPINVRMGNAESSILSLGTKVDIHTSDITALKLYDASQTSLNSTLALSADLIATNNLLGIAQQDILSLDSRVDTIESRYFSPTF